MSGGGEEQTQTTSVPGFVKRSGKQTFRAGRQLAQSPTGATGFLGQSENFVSPFAQIPGAEAVAGLAPGQQLGGLTAVSRLLGGTPASNAAQGTVAALADPNAAFSPLTNQLVESAQGNLVDQFNLNVAPNLSARSFSPSAGNTGLAEFGNAQRFGLARALGETESGIRNQALNRSLQAANLAPALGQIDRGRLQDVLGFGGLQRGVNQAQLSAEAQQFLEQRNEALRRLQILQGARPQGNFGGTTTQSTDQNAGFGTFAGAGLGLVGLGAQFGDLPVAGGGSLLGNLIG